MRLFAAVLPPDDVVDALAAEVEVLRGLPGAERLRWTGRPGWHLTLAFYGEVGEETVPELEARLGKTARRTEPFALALRGGGQFGRGQALWTGAEGDLRTLGQLAGRAEAAGRKAGLETGEHRRYRAHLTVARGRQPVDVRPHLDALRAFGSRTWTVDAIVLVRSFLPASGVPGEQPRYEPVGRWPLGSAGQASGAAG
ncbi:RNA 2',3'-cyclic phosphodiesterase [Streptomyces sp. NPDC006743]|uniref:RNA 2',3'-cyclic phosphodiesterase n=1 Tax=Streptomyces sp. NPDC006743 TaxID=3154480 RepID=UPI003456B286